MPSDIKLNTGLIDVFAKGNNSIGFIRLMLALLVAPFVTCYLLVWLAIYLSGLELFNLGIYLYFIICNLITYSFALISWHLIESKALGIRIKTSHLNKIKQNA